MTAALLAACGLVACGGAVSAAGPGLSYRSVTAGSAETDPLASYTMTGDTGPVLVFHALKMTEAGAMYGWVKTLGWQNDWPVLQ